MSKISRASKVHVSAPKRNVPVPARSRIAVNKSVQDINAKGKPNDAQKKISPENEKLDEIFAGNIAIAVALTPTVPFKCECFLNFVPSGEEIRFRCLPQTWKAFRAGFLCSLMARRRRSYVIRIFWCWFSRYRTSKSPNLSTRIHRSRCLTSPSSFL